MTAKIVTAEDAYRLLDAAAVRLSQPEHYAEDRREFDLAHTVVVQAEQIAAVRWAVRDHDSCKRKPCQVCAALGVTA